MGGSERGPGPGSTEMTFGVCSVHSQRVNGSCQPRNKGVPPLIFFDLRGWLIAGFPFLRPHL
ncbi:hypothetical protein J6590_061320 [Homalodisca vitripennis]|nr:hypothetical protein J6590_061320 [Homalodisca vitripennis]